MSVNISGLASGFDWTSFIDQMVAAEQAPEQTMRATQAKINQRNSAFGSIKTELTTLNSQLTKLQQASFFSTRLAQSSDTTVAAATVDGTPASGQYSLRVDQLATASVYSGANKLGAPLSSSNDVSGVVLSNAGFALPVTSGTITVNGHQITIDATKDLQTVFSDISSATGNTVTGSYDPTSDTISLTSSAGKIVLGSANDTSNFLQAAKLNNNNSSTVTSSSPLGAVRLDVTLAQLSTPGQGHLGTALTQTTGTFKINGMDISYSASDTLTDVLNRINSSSAGVSARYDAAQGSFVLTNQATGDMGVALEEDDGGNFLAATGLSLDAGKLQEGHDLLYSINGGAQQQSHSNTLNADNSGFTGLSVSVVNTGTTTLSVSSDTATIKKAITDFVTEFNKIQSLITTNTASSTSAAGKVTAGLLSNDGEADDIASQLRLLANTRASSLTGTIKSLDDLGIASNGYDNTLSVGDGTKLDEALANHLSDVQAFFTDVTSGLATNLNNYLSKTLGDNGILATKQNSLTQQSSGIDTQIATLEKTIANDKQRMTDEFTAMEEVQARINQQMTYLAQTFGGSSK